MRIWKTVTARVGLSSLAFGALLLAACATPPPPDDPEAVAVYEEINDPLEPMNRTIFEFNQFFDGILFKPVALLYRTFLPQEVRNGVTNFLANLNTPVDLANQLLQGDMDGAANSVGRFAVNTTAGVGGLMDVASDVGLEPETEDFGQTLAVWGSGEGAYLVLPIIGPSSARDGVGLVVDIFLDPLTYFVDTELRVARTMIRAVDARERAIDTLDEIERTSIDFYAALRSLYRQRRADEIRDGAPRPVVPIPAISIEDFEDPEDEQISQVD